MDFIADALADGRRLRCLAIVNDCTRECLEDDVDWHWRGLVAGAALATLLGAGAEMAKSDDTDATQIVQAIRESARRPQTRYASS
jgi:type IV secretory pathway VirB10-like protein